MSRRTPPAPARKAPPGRPPRRGRPPLPGETVRGSATGRPIMAALDLLGRRWTLRIFWELRLGALTFRALQSACGGLSPSVLQERLSELAAARLVVAGTRRDGAGYALTPLAHRLMPALLSLEAWSQEWAASLARGTR
jgi:DNA-binding HxlR family transcriptional regulator